MKKLLLCNLLLCAFFVNAQEHNHDHDHNKRNKFETDTIESKQLKSLILLIKQKQNQRSANYNLPIYFSKTDSIIGKVNLQKNQEEGLVIIGEGDHKTDNFEFTITKDGKLSGDYISIKNKKAFKYITNQDNQLLIEEVDVNEKICIDYKKVEFEEDEYPLNSPEEVPESQPDLQSLPGSPYVVYLDMDGEVSTSRWAGGQTINAQPMGFSLDQMRSVWELVAEDFRPFNLNVTTNRAVFDATPQNRRMMCILTTTNTAAPGSGGVAYIGSFSWNNNDPCWTFNRGVKSAAETTSHEIGHTLFLQHDGLTNGTVYYNGHNNWAPIMGSSMSQIRTATHWDIGEYANANNQQNDLSDITTRNGFGYRQDDHGNTIQNATLLDVNFDGTVNGNLNINQNVNGNGGIIERNTDIDVFRLDIPTSGNVNLTAAPHPNYPNLNIKLDLLNSDGDIIQTSDPNNNVSATINTSLNSGTYYFKVDGVGDGANPSVGYSDYNSMGVYTLNGEVPPPSPLPVVNFKADAQKGCSGIQVQFTDESFNNPESWLWTFEGGNPATSNNQNPLVTYNQPGIYNVTLKSTNSFGENTLLKESYIEVINIGNPIASDLVICEEEEVTLTAQALNSDVIRWYSSNSDNDLINEGNSYTTNINQNTTFYLKSFSEALPENVGLIEPDDINGAFHQGGFYLVFDAEQSFTLKSALVRADGEKSRILELRDANDNLLDSIQILIPNGDSRIDIDLEIPQGQNLKIGFATGADLFRNRSNIDYPFTIDGVVNIKSSTANSDPFGFYYYLFDWEIIADKRCESDFTSVNVILDICTNTNEVTNESFKLSPNPFNDVVNINIQSKSVNLNVYESNGKLVDTKVYQQGENIYFSKDLTPGVYIFELIDENTIKTFRLIKR